MSYPAHPALMLGRVSYDLFAPLRSMDDVAALKQTAGGPISVHASARLAQSLAAAGLVDRYHLLVFPIVLGSGRRLFTDSSSEKQRLSLAESPTRTATRSSSTTSFGSRV